MTDRLLRALNRPVDGGSLAAFRVMFGAIMAGGLIRYVNQGWVDVVFVKPTFFFKYPGFEWVAVPGPVGLYGLFAAAGVGALGVALGLFYRWALAVFLGAFLYIQLMDVTNYLNHYYLVILLSGLMLFMPLDRRMSVRVWRRPQDRIEKVPVWMVHLLRFQVAMVYLHAALAKLGTDWLVHGQPMNLWMAARSEMFGVGPILASEGVPLAMSWVGFLYDLTIVGWLSWRRTRPFAYGAVLVFHGCTGALFEIGMFPFIMTVATTVFFEPNWPSALRNRWNGTRSEESEPVPVRVRRLHPSAAVCLLLFCGVQFFWPLRHHAVGGDVLWHEQGMRFAWKVMVREKNGSLTYRVRDPRSGREWQVSPRRYLDWRQANEMAGQPDLIRQLAHTVARDFAERGVPDVEVRVDAWVSLNGRPARRLIDPSVNLLQVETGFLAHLQPASWILAGPTEPPPPVRSRGLTAPGTAAAW